MNTNCNIEHLPKGIWAKCDKLGLNQMHFCRFYIFSYSLQGFKSFVDCEYI